MTEDFLAQVQDAFGYLQEKRGYRLVRFGHPQVFDNVSVEFWLEGLAVSIARERGHCSASVGPAPRARYDLDLICRLLGDQTGQRVATQERPALQDLAAVLRRHLPEIERMFTPSLRAETENRLQVAGEARAATLFGWQGKVPPAT